MKAKRVFMSFESPPQSPPPYTDPYKALFVIRDRAKKLLLDSQLANATPDAVFEYLLSEISGNSAIEKDWKQKIEEDVGYYKNRFGEKKVGEIEYKKITGWLDKFPPKKPFVSFEKPSQPATTQEQESDKALIVMRDRAEKMLEESRASGSPKALNAFYEYLLLEAAENPLIEDSEKQQIITSVAFYKKKFRDKYMGATEHAELFGMINRFPPKRY